MKTSPAQSGFIALISILIISAVLLATTLSLAQFGIANRFFILNLEQKAASEKLAEACVHIARISAYNDPTYRVIPADNGYIEIAGGGCEIYSVSTNSGITIIEATASSSEAITNLSVETDANGNFTKWQEVSKF